MTMYDLDPDVRWGLHLTDVCSLTNNGYPQTVTCYEVDMSRTESVKEGFLYSTCSTVESDEVLAHALQEELSRLAVAESSGSSYFGEQPLEEYIPAQDFGTSRWQLDLESQGNQEEEGKWEAISSNNEELYTVRGELDCFPELEDESAVDGELGKRLNHMVPVPHVPKINGEIPSADEATSDHQRLLNRLQLYDLVELKISGDGNCQFDALSENKSMALPSLRLYSSTPLYPVPRPKCKFRSLSDQIYRSPEHHKFVREQIVNQLKSQPEMYENYVPMAYDDYLKKMSKTGEWGDHITLQAGADWFGIKILVITSFKDTCYIEILPQTQKSDRTICLSFWAEVHYNSIYPLGEMPTAESNKKTKKWLW